MISFQAQIKDPIGLHARPASLVVQTASQFKSKITISHKEKGGGDLKSIMNVMSLGIMQGDEITIEADGEDAETAIAAIEKTMKENKLI